MNKKEGAAMRCEWLGRAAKQYAAIAANLTGGGYGG